MTNDQMKKQVSNKAGTYTATGFVPSKGKQPKKSITLLDILLGRK